MHSLPSLMETPLEETVIGLLTRRRHPDFPKKIQYVVKRHIYTWANEISEVIRLNLKTDPKTEDIQARRNCHDYFQVFLRALQPLGMPGDIGYTVSSERYPKSEDSWHVVLTLYEMIS